MTVNKIFLVLFFIPFLCFAQERKTDVYHILNNNNPEYVFEFSTLEHKNTKDYLKVSLFKLYNKIEYIKKKELIEKEKKSGKYNQFKNYSIISFAFVVKTINEINITDCKISKLKIVDFEWLKTKSWSENSLNEFHDLYFLYKINGNKYAKYKVERIPVSH